MAAARDFIPIVKAIVAEQLQDRSIREVRASETLHDLGILPDRIPELTVRFYRTVGSRDFGDYQRFAGLLSIKPDSSIQNIAAQFAHASTHLSRAPLKALSGDPTEPDGFVEAAVRTAVAGKSRTHSVGEIRSNQKLGHLGLDEADVADVKTNVYRMLSGGKVRPKFTLYLKDTKITGASTVGQAVKLSRKAFMRVKDFTDDPTDIWG
jgi:hypothetical protein